MIDLNLVAWATLLPGCAFMYLSNAKFNVQTTDCFRDYGAMLIMVASVANLLINLGHTTI